jgi:hypothetical protein
MRYECLLGAVIVFALAGCKSVSYHGDAKVYDRADFPFEALDSLCLPEFSVSESGAVYRWEIRDLPQPVSPGEIILFAKKDDVPGPAPWQAVELRVELFALDGTKIDRREISFSQWNGGGYYNDPGWDVSFGLQKFQLQGMQSYDVVVTVLKPSPRSGDRAQLQGLFKLGWDNRGLR